MSLLVLKRTFTAILLIMLLNWKQKCEYFWRLFNWIIVGICGASWRRLLPIRWVPKIVFCTSFIIHFASVLIAGKRLSLSRLDHAHRPPCHKIGSDLRKMGGHWYCHDYGYGHNAKALSPWIIQVARWEFKELLLPFLSQVRKRVFGPSMLWVGENRTCSYTRKKNIDQVYYNGLVP